MEKGGPPGHLNGNCTRVLSKGRAFGKNDLMSIKPLVPTLGEAGLGKCPHQPIKLELSDALSVLPPGV